MPLPCHDVGSQCPVSAFHESPFASCQRHRLAHTPALDRRDAQSRLAAGTVLGRVFTRVV